MTILLWSDWQLFCCSIALCCWTTKRTTPIFLKSWVAYILTLELPHYMVYRSHWFHHSWISVIHILFMRIRNSKHPKLSFHSYTQSKRYLRLPYWKLNLCMSHKHFSLLDYIGIYFLFAFLSQQCTPREHVLIEIYHAIEELT